MTPGYNARCRACNSPHRAAIDERLLKGETTRAVAAWLETACGEQLSHQALANHKGSHLPVLQAVRERSIAAAQPAFEKAVDRAESSLAALEEIMALGLKVARGLAPVLEDPLVEHPDSRVSLFNGALREARQAAVAHQELLNGGKKVNVETSGGLGDLLALAFAEEGGGEDPPGAVDP